MQMTNWRHAAEVAVPASAFPIGVGALTGLGLLYSQNIDLWLVCLGSLWITILCLGGRKTHPIFWWFIIVSWSRVFADVVLADVNGLQLGELQYREKAIIYSLVALFFMACGIRFGYGTGKRVGQEHLLQDKAWTPTLKQVLGVYLCALPILGVIAALATLSQETRQLFGSFLVLKFVLLYWVAAVIYQSGRGYHVLILILGAEVIFGFTGFFASFKEPIIIVCIAALSFYPEGRLGAIITKRFVIFTLLAGMAVWLSLIWITVRTDYRAWLSEGSGEQVVSRTLPERFEWLSNELFTDKLMNGNIEYERATELLLSRIAYTQYYAMLLERLDAGLIPSDEYRWLGTLKRIMMPRLLFPDKAAVNDSETTKRLLGISIDSKTSISVGYIAETHVDFGFPLMLVPLYIIGFAMGRVARMFAAINAPMIIRNGFICGALLLSFTFESAIDKALPGFVLTCVALALCAKYAYPALAHKLWHKGGFAVRAAA
jgi:hypothetical protein